MKKIAIILVIGSLISIFSNAQTVFTNLQALKQLKPLITKKQGDVSISVIAIFRDGHFTTLPTFPLQTEHGAAIYIIGKREGKTFPSQGINIPRGTMYWEDEMGRKSPAQGGYLIVGEDAQYFYARYTWRNLVIPSSTRRLTIVYNLYLPEKKYFFFFKDVKLPQEEAIGKPLVSPLKVRDKVKINGKNYTILASQVQGDLRVSLFSISRVSSLILPGYKGVEIGILVEGFDKPLPKGFLLVSTLSWKDEKGNTSSSWRGETYRQSGLADPQKSTTDKILASWRYKDVYFWKNLEFPPSPKYLIIQYNLFIFPNKKYNFVFKNVCLP